MKHGVIHKMGLHADGEGAVTLNVWQKKQNKKGCPRIIFIKWHEMNYVPQIFSYGLCLTRSYWTVKDAEYHRILREKSKCWEKQREKPSVACSGACRKCNQSLFFLLWLKRSLRNVYSGYILPLNNVPGLLDCASCLKTTA